MPSGITYGHNSDCFDVSATGGTTIRKSKCKSESDRMLWLAIWVQNQAETPTRSECVWNVPGALLLLFEYHYSPDSSLHSSLLPPPCSPNLVPDKFDTPPSDQDDCLAINSGNNIKFLNNYCSGGHGISIGSIASGKVSAWSTPSLCVHSHSLPLLDSLECPHFQEHGRPLGERPPNQDGRRCDERLCFRRESRLRCCSFAPPTILWRYFIQNGENGFGEGGKRNRSGCIWRADVFRCFSVKH